MRNRIGSLLLFLAALAVGCSDDDDASDFGPRFCALFKPCCDKAGLPGDQSTCRMLYGSARPTSRTPMGHAILRMQSPSRHRTMPRPSVRSSFFRARYYPP